MGAQFTIDGEQYKVTMGDLTALDVGALRKQTGKSFPSLLSELFSDDADIDTIAAVHVAARGGSTVVTDLTFAEVAAETGYDVITKLSVGAGFRGRRGQVSRGDDSPEG
jgi:hypothetical protein